MQPELKIALPHNGYPRARRWPRHKVDVSVSVIAHGPTKGAAVQGRGSALNCGGMTLYAGVELSIGDQVAVEFTPPDAGQPITVRCFVRNGHGGTYGVEFITENDADYERVGQIESILSVMGSPVSPLLSLEPCSDQARGNGEQVDQSSGRGRPAGD